MQKMNIKMTFACKGKKTIYLNQTRTMETEELDKFYNDIIELKKELKENKDAKK